MIKSCSTPYATALIVVIHLLTNFVHGVAHRELHVGLSARGSVCVIIVVLLLSLVSMALVCANQIELGLGLLSISMLASFLFALSHHFLIISPDHVHSQPATAWRIALPSRRLDC